MTTVEQNTFGISESLIQQVTERIVRKCHPHKIILFGSLAWSKPKPYCDLDLLIIMNSNVRRPDERAMEIETMLDGFNCPMDLIVYAPDVSCKQFEEKKSVRSRYFGEKAGTLCWII